MNWVNGVYTMGIVITCVSLLGIAIALGYLINAGIEGEPINWERTYPTIAVLTVALLAGAFMAGAAA